MYRKFSKRHDIEYDPFKGIERLSETQMSTRNLAFTKEDQAVLEKYLIENNYPLYLFTGYMYFAFIRTMELRFLKVKHVQTSRKSKVIPGQIPKNRKTVTVAIIPSLFKGVKLEKVNSEYFHISFSARA